MTPQVNLFGSTFITLTSLHGAHVSLGILWLIFLLINEYRGNFLTTQHLYNQFCLFRPP